MNYKLLILILMGILFLYDLYLKYRNQKSVERPIPENVKDLYDEEEYRKWLSYFRDKSRLSLFYLLASYIELFLMFGFNVYARLLRLFSIEGDYLSANAVLMIDVVVTLLYAVPFAYIRTMGVEQKYGFNRMTKKTFISDQIKDTIIELLLTCGLVSLFIFIHKALGNWMLPVFVAIMMVIILLVVFLAPFFGRIYNKLEPLPEGELRDKLTKLLTDNGMRIRDIKVSDGSKRSTKANAYFSGFGKTKTIVLYDTLLEQMETEEIVAVFAHEMGHSKHKDTLKLNLLNIINITVYVLMIWALISIPEIYEDFGFTGVNYGFAFLLLGSVLAALLSPLLGVVSAGIQRRAEYRADAFAAKNGYGRALMTGLCKLTKNSLDHLNPDPLIVALTYSHPPISSRLAAIKKCCDAD